MSAGVARTSRGTEHYTEERCYIKELLNSPSDPQASVAQARVEVGVTTALHRLNGVHERYVVLAVRGGMQVGRLPTEHVRPGDVVDIPAGASQRITNVGDEDLVFLCVCTPRFWPGSWNELEPERESDRQASAASPSQGTLEARGLRANRSQAPPSQPGDAVIPPRVTVRSPGAQTYGHNRRRIPRRADGRRPASRS